MRFCFGSNGSVTPSPAAVVGMSCMSPWAPARETALGSKPDSARATALTRAGGTLFACAASRIIASYGEGSPSPVAAGVAPVAAAPGMAGAAGPVPNCVSSTVWKLSCGCSTGAGVGSVGGA
jgi:hypothetical protein